MADSEETQRALRRRVRAEGRLLLVVAGPNGAGKSTFAETFLKPTGILVVNPDEVAKGLSRTPRRPSPTKLPVWQIRGAVISWLEVFRSAWRRFLRSPWSQARLSQGVSVAGPARELGEQSRFQGTS